MVKAWSNPKKHEERYVRYSHAPTKIITFLFFLKNNFHFRFQFSAISPLDIVNIDIFMWFWLLLIMKTPTIGHLNWLNCTAKTEFVVLPQTKGLKNVNIWSVKFKIKEHYVLQKLRPNKYSDKIWDRNSNEKQRVKVALYHLHQFII